MILELRQYLNAILFCFLFYETTEIKAGKKLFIYFQENKDWKFSVEYFGSWLSIYFGEKSTKRPNKMCWTTGNLRSTSAWYILIKPPLTLVQETTLLMFQSWFECSANGPFLTVVIYLRAWNIMFSSWYRSIKVCSTKSFGSILVCSLNQAKKSEVNNSSLANSSPFLF